jgi:hypothetical protein
MPQATDEDRQKMIDIFGTFNDSPIVKELESRDFILTDKWEWFRHSSPNDFEEMLINFLCDEWDFGWYTDEATMEEIHVSVSTVPADAVPSA